MITLSVLRPPSKFAKEERIREILYEDFLSWARSDPIRKLFCLFRIIPSMDDLCRLYKGKDFLFSLQQQIAMVWDFRKMQREATSSDGEAARWLLKNTEFTEAHRNEIMAAAEGLGLVNETDSIFDEVDYILPLGGARMSNLYRPMLARRTADKISVKEGIVALSTYRPIAESEKEGYIDTYAHEALTEFDAMSKGMIKAFDVAEKYHDEKKQNENMNLASNVREYEETYNGSPLYVIAAPSSDENRRANSADCFDYFFRSFDVKKGSKILNCTSQIYVPYQQVRALKYAIKHDVEFDTIGYSDNSNTKVTFGPVNYLQEIKGTIDAMCDFVKEFKDYIDE